MTIEEFVKQGERIHARTVAPRITNRASALALLDRLIGQADEATATDLADLREALLAGRLK